MKMLKNKAWGEFDCQLMKFWTNHGEAKYDIRTSVEIFCTKTDTDQWQTDYVKAI